MSSINKIKVGGTVYTIADGTEPLIAPVQETLVASKAYAVGEQFIYNGNLYKATAPIASGATITINGNCALADSIADQVTELNTALNTFQPKVRGNGGNPIDYVIRIKYDSSKTTTSNGLVDTGINKDYLISVFSEQTDAYVSARPSSTSNNIIIHFTYANGTDYANKAVAYRAYYLEPI